MIFCGPTHSDSSRIYNLDFGTGLSGSHLSKTLRFLEEVCRSTATFSIAKKRTFAQHHSQHYSQQQVRLIKNSLSVQFGQQGHIVTLPLHTLNEAVIDAGSSVPVSLHDAGVLPQDCKRRYNYIESVEKGLGVPFILVMY